jgi:hypothetical protein
MSAPRDPVAEIRRLYYATSKQTIGADLARAIDLLKQLPGEEARQRAAVFMDGLAQLRSEWGVREAGPGGRRRRRGQRV